MSQNCPKCLREINLPGPPILFCCFCGSSMSGVALPPTSDATFTHVHGSPTVVEVPERLGGYRLLRKLGQGGMGAVFEGEDEATGRRVAVKVIDAEATDSALERFRQEGRLASAVSHPRCVFVYAADEDQGRPYIVLELMPGKTLEDLVQERGPLPLDEAIRYAFDLIDGLQQVHQLGVIHRDVKPSNCFLDAEGRLKVGDFGLARSLAPSAKLTRTGAFVGTPLFAAPEQILNQPLDPRADVFAACATLYYLLTGKAPHDAGDSDYMAALARVVSDDPPPIRSRRPELPAAVEHALARGLSRDREGRFADLEDLRVALAGVRPSRAPWRLFGARFAAYVIDYVLMYPILMVVLFATGPADQPTMTPTPEKQALGLAIYLVYFGVCEWLAARTFGKWLLGLRVTRADTAAKPGAARALARAALWTVPPMLPSLLLVSFAQGTGQVQAMLVAFAMSGGALAVYVAFFATMRPSNGFRTLYDMLSGTRVVAEGERRGHARFAVPAVEQATLPPDAPSHLGPYSVQSLQFVDDAGYLYLGLDAALGRNVWLWLRRGDAVPEPRRAVLRPTRLRWLGGGTQVDWRWDAFLAPRGGPAAAVVAGYGAMAWDEARPLLESLLAELREGADDSTLPDRLSLEQVWLSPDGTAQVIDLPAGPTSPPAAPLDLVGQLAALLVEGKPTQGVQTAGLPPVPLPGHARRWLGQLPWFGGEEDQVRWAEQSLHEHRDRPGVVSRNLRTLHLVLLLGAMMFCGGSCLSTASIGGIFPVIFLSVTLENQVGQVEIALAESTARDVVGVVAAGSPLGRLTPALRLPRREADQKRLAASRAEAQAYLDARKASLWEPQRSLVDQIIANAKAQQKIQQPQKPNIDRPAWDRVESAIEVLKLFREMPAFTWVGVGALAALVLVITLSAFIFRGGVRYHMLGLELVRRDGRPAGRFRCAWRALVAWLPACAMLAAARVIEDSFWAKWSPGVDMTTTNVLVPLLQIGAYLVLVILLVSSLAWPTRAPHDYLAGTRIVPA